jgi:hypothetical protein
MFHTADDVIWRLARLFVHSWIELVKRESLINLTAQALRDCEWWRFDISRRVIDREHRCFSQLHPPIGPMQGPAHLDRSEGHGKSLLNWRRPCNSHVLSPYRVTRGSVSTQVTGNRCSIERGVHFGHGTERRWIKKDKCLILQEGEAMTRQPCQNHLPRSGWRLRMQR